MNIRSKIVLITLPLIITPLLLTAVIASLSARNGITFIATDFLKFKMETLANYMDNQWSLLKENDLTENEEFLEVTQSAVEVFAGNLIRSDTEVIFAVDPGGNVVIRTGEIAPNGAEQEQIKNLIARGERGWTQLTVGGVERVAQTDYFEPFGWYVLVTEERNTFYGTIQQILVRTGIILASALIIAVILLIVFSSFITKPLQSIVDVIRDIIATSDLSQKVTLRYRDETGKLGHYFNIMTEELDKAYNQIKGYALKAVLAQNKEKKIRNIFQKYVPKNVIDQFFENPEGALIGENRVLSVLFSDIRSFTTISEGMQPDELVQSLNKYFELMVDIIVERRGVVDKYIGDAIMAFFGAPARAEDDPEQAVLAGLEMSDGLKEFNQWQKSHGRPDFKIGVGINYGVVTIGNIGSEKKMDYTVIGDMVNLASRLEGLTKLYREHMLISESLQRKVKDTIPCRMLDRVVVKGKTEGVKIFTARKELTVNEKEAWEIHEEAVTRYFDRDFKGAMKRFLMVHELLPEDHCAELFIGRCEEYMVSPPAEDWTGDVFMRGK